MREYPQHRLIQLDALTVVLAWLALVCILALLFFGLASSAFASDGVIIVMVVIFILFSLAHFFLSFQHRCPECLKHPTIQGFSPVHPKARAQSGMQGWTRVVWDVLRKRQFSCIHCGETYHVNNAT